MKRLRTILVFLLLGAVVNVGVAWAVNNYVSGWVTESWVAIPDSRTFWLQYNDAIPPRCEIIRGEIKTAFGVVNQYCELLEGGVFHPPGWCFLSVQRVGWPMRSLFYIHRGQCGRQGRTVDTVTGAARIRQPEFIPFRIPGRGSFPFYIDAPGFLLNCVFYGVLLWLPFAGGRQWRRFRGRCPACAYELRGGEHERCPECGLPTSRARQ